MIEKDVFIKDLVQYNAVRLVYSQNYEAAVKKAGVKIV